MKERLDKVLVSSGLVKSRELARALVIEGKVFVDNVRSTKAGMLIKDDAHIEVKDSSLPFVSRGGLKLEAAIEYFNVKVEGKSAIDIGASTGGFTDCLLKRGVRKVFCIDVGYGQLAWQIRNDPRVVVMERTNMRHLAETISGSPDHFTRPEFSELVTREIDLATIDVSFISLRIIMPEALLFLKSGGEVLALVKPQFEAGKGEVGKGGIVRDEEKRLRIVAGLTEHFESLGVTVSGPFESPVPGQKGNREFFVYLHKEQAGRKHERGLERSLNGR